MSRVAVASLRFIGKSGVTGRNVAVAWKAGTERWEMVTNWNRLEYRDVSLRTTNRQEAELPPGDG